MITNTNLGSLIDFAATEWKLGRQFHQRRVHAAVPYRRCRLGAGRHVGRRQVAALPRVRPAGDPRRAVTTQKVTNALFVPAMLQFLCMVPSAAEGDYSHLRSIVYGASPITNDVLLKAMQTFNCDFIQVYGLTETTGAITQLSPEDHDPEGPRADLLRSAGKPYAWVELRVVDGEGNDVARGRSASCGHARCRT